MSDSDFVVIAHRGASGYLPENTLASASLAHSMGVDFVEMDVVLTRDDVPIVFHDLFLDELVVNFSELVGPKREDGKSYLVDCEWEEIRSIGIGPRQLVNGQLSCPMAMDGHEILFQIPTLGEMVELIRKLNIQSGKNVGLYIEPKDPEFHFRNGKDVLDEVISVLHEQRFLGQNFPVCLQSFDMKTIKRLTPSEIGEFKLVKLLGEEYDPSSDLVGDLICELVETVDGIGPPISLVVDQFGNPIEERLRIIEKALDSDLFVHAWHSLENRLPMPFPDMNTAVENLRNLGINGLFTDHPDQLVKALEKAI